MAVSVRIEDEAFSDVRIEILGELAGYSRYEALGRMAALWRICTQRQRHVLSETMVVAAIGPNGADHLVGAELGERVAEGIRVCGTEGRIEWLGQLSSTRQRAGQARAATATRDSRGRLVASSTPANAQQPTSTAPASHQQTPSSPPAQSSAPSPSPSPSPVTAQKNPEGEGANAPPPLVLAASASKGPRLRRIPANWQPTAEHRTIAAQESKDCDREAVKFRDHFVGKGTPMADWDATFRNWLRRAEFGPSRSGANGQRDVRVGRVEPRPATDYPDGVMPL